LKKYFIAVLLSTAPLFAFAASNSGSFSNTVVNALIRGVIYGGVFKLFHTLGLGGSLIAGAILLGGAYLWKKKNP
jgi:hypothetical protein